MASPRQGTRYASNKAEKRLFTSLEHDLENLRKPGDLISRAARLRIMAEQVYSARGYLNGANMKSSKKAKFASAIFGLWEEALGDVTARHLELYGADGSAYDWKLEELTNSTLNREYDIRSYMEEVVALDVKGDFTGGASWDFVERVIREVHRETVTVQHPFQSAPVQKKQIADRLIFLLMQMAAIMSHRYFKWEIQILGHVVPRTGVNEEIGRPTTDTSSSRDPVMHRIREKVRKRWVWLEGKAQNVRVKGSAFASSSLIPAMQQINQGVREPWRRLKDKAKTHFRGSASGYLDVGGRRRWQMDRQFGQG